MHPNTDLQEILKKLERIASALEIANQMKQDELTARGIRISNPLMM